MRPPRKKGYLNKLPFFRRPFSFYPCLVLIFLLPLISGCQSVLTVQPQVNSLVVARRFDRALQVLSEQKKGYGKNNELLYLLDEGLVLHFAGRYQESIGVFARAKLKYDELYTESLTRLTSSWVWNDYILPYRGEDFERVLINVFQALNYMALNDIESALVEARDTDAVLKKINFQYHENQRNVYAEDAFARFLMGILYEAGGRAPDLNDAFIDYVKAFKIYQSDYAHNYGVPVPSVLKENLLAAADWMGGAEGQEYGRILSGIPYQNFKQKSALAEIYVIHYQGLSPVKIEDSIVVPLPDGYMTRFSFPRYRDRIYDNTPKFVRVADSQGQEFTAQTELVENINGIAQKNLENRKLRTIAKGILRPAGKYLLEKTGEKAIEENSGREAGHWFRFFAILYNIYSEQADLRSWQILPAEIRLGRIQVPPGDYTVQLSQETLGKFTLKAGEKKFLFVRTN